MLINKDIAISTSSVLLVPYEEHHVPTYHSWMQDEEIQQATASEPLTLEQEFAMQRSWRTDRDKLTFIACLPLPSHLSKPHPCVMAQEGDTRDQMLGDINLFLTPADEDLEGCIGEVELMIAPQWARRRGYGKAALLTFLMYVENNLDSILEEYGASLMREANVANTAKELREQAPSKMRLLQLRVKIGSKNEKSLNLFTSVGFVKVSEEPNYFDEVEMVFEGFLGKGRMEGLLGRWGIEGYQELSYCRGGLLPSSRNIDLEY